MIRINLLPREERPKKVTVRIPQAAVGVVATLAAVAMFAYWRSVKWEISRLQDEAVMVRQEIARNKQVVQLVERYARDKQQLQDRLAIIRRLLAAQEAPVRLLDGISQALPDEVWLTGVTKTSGRLVVQGYASSHFAVANLMVALGRLKPMIGSVELNFSERHLFENKPVERFEIVVMLAG
jgi:Tfp pilus assembly protein PilN